MASRVGSSIPQSLMKPADNIVITAEDARTITDIATRSAKIATTTTCAYTTSLPAKVLLSKTSNALMYGGKGVVIGGATGAIVGFSGGPTAPVSVPVCAAIGGGIGGIVGLTYGAYTVHKQTQREFSSWKSSQNAKILDEFRNAFKEHGALQVCIDPQSLEPMILPAHCSCTGAQHTFDYETFKSLADARRACPLAFSDADRSRLIRIEEVRIDYRTMGVISVAYIQLLETGASVAKLSPRLMKGIEALVNDLRRHKALVFKMEKEDICRQLDRTEDGDRIVMLTQRLATIAVLLNPKIPKSV